MDAAAFDRAARRFHKRMINADRSHLDVEAFDAELLLQLLLNRLACFRAQAADTLVSVVSGERR